MIRIGWFSPISAKTGIATYSGQVLEEVKAQFPDTEVQVIVFHPHFEGKRVEMPYPTVALSDSLLQSDFHALFDVAVYHLGNNSLHHAPIYAALMRHPGVVVLHDHVYQHYLAGVSLHDDHVSASFVIMAEDAAPGSFQLVKSSGVMRCDQGRVAFVPWESEWATQVTMSAPFVDMAFGAIVHSDYARSGIGGSWRSADDVQTLFMPRPEIDRVPPPDPESGRIRLACCGHIGTTKGLNQLLNAFIKTPELHQKFHVVIAGFGSDQSYLASLRRTIQDARLGGVFEIKVDPSDEDYHDVMADCDIFYNLRYPNTEGASLSLMEQLAYGRPVIAYRTGSFAEVPEDVCYFLDRIGDDHALIEVLQQIAANPSDVIRKGKAAQAAVAGKTAADYARRFVSYLQHGQETFSRRGSLARARVNGMLPDPQEDRDWLAAFLKARKSMDMFYENRLFLTSRFQKMSPREKGTFILANHLNVNADTETAEKAGTEFDRLSDVELYDVVGKLLVIVSLASGADKYVQKHLSPMIMPLDDLRIWRLLALLPARLSVYLAMQNLRVALTLETLATLVEAVEQFGFKVAIRNFLQQSDSDTQARIAKTCLMEYLDKIQPDEVETFPVLDHGVNALVRTRALWPTPMIAIDGFHALEEIGIWTRTTVARMYVNLDSASPANHIAGVMGLLRTSGFSGAAVRVCVEEMASGRVATTTVKIAPEDADPVRWQIPLSGFAGPQKISFETDTLVTPAKEGLSSDTRELGVLVQSIIFGGTAAELEAAAEPAAGPEEDTAPLETMEAPAELEGDEDTPP